MFWPQELALHKGKIRRCIVCLCPKRLYTKKLPRETFYVDLGTLGGNRTVQKFRMKWVRELKHLVRENKFPLKRRFIDSAVECIGTKEAQRGGGIDVLRKYVPFSLLCCNKVKLSPCKRSMIHAKFMRIPLIIIRAKPCINDNSRYSG